MDGVPIACTLDAAALRDRAGAWRALVASSVTSVDVDEAAVRLLLDPSDRALTAAVALAQAEKACCPFFEVSLDVQADGCTLVVAVPDGAHEVLAGFVTMLSD